ncbi:hypothetical protein AB0896_27375 [Streptomyces parvulus]|uniref:hypothetical protein n=1 Tax=Streptomyces parvulus TaxID=146923 RepID=UPI003454985D
MITTRWNGEPCQARPVTAVVTDDGSFPGYWARDHVGTRRAVVEVTYGGSTFYLDDEDGTGWAKVTSGGSPSHGHRSLTVAPDSIQPRSLDDHPAATEATSPTEHDDHVRTHIKALLTELKEQRPDQLAQPAGLFISGMLTGLAASVQVLDGATAEETLETVNGRLEATIGRAYLNGTLTDTFPDKVLSVEMQKVDAILQDLGVEGDLGARGVATLANTARVLREELQRAETAFAQLREGEEPLAEGQHPATASPAQWLWLWNRSTPAERLARAEQIIKVSQDASACFLENHGPKIEQLRHRVSHAEAAVTRTLHAMQLHRADGNTPVSPGKVIDLLTRPAPDSTTEAPEPGTWDQAEQLRADAADSMTAHTKELLARRTETLRKRAEEAEAERDGAYRERAHLVALLAAMTDGAVIAPAPDVEEPGWQIAYLTIGGRQASWHISPRDAALFADVEHVPGDEPRAHWDGHSTDDKYARIRQHTRLLARRCGPACAEAHTYTGRCESAHQVDDSDATAPDVVHPDTDAQASSPQQVDAPCPQHPHAPTFDGMCGGCTQYPADMQPAAPAREEQPDVQQ